VVTLPGAIADLKSSEFLMMNDITVIAAASRDVRKSVIPLLEARFSSSQRTLTREQVAASLVRLGDKDETSWNFLVARAIPAAEDDAPFPFEIGPNRRVTKNTSPAFLRWAADHHLSKGQALENEAFDNPGAIEMLGFTKDPRAVPILQMALASPSYFVEAAAADGLADLGDKASIPLIIEACSRAPADAAAVMARSLVYFDTRGAQQAVELYASRETAAEYRKERSEGIDVYGDKPLGWNPARSTPPGNPHP